MRRWSSAPPGQSSLVRLPKGAQRCSGKPPDQPPPVNVDRASKVSTGRHLSGLHVPAQGVPRS